jgi:hypothetical protein
MTAPLSPVPSALLLQPSPVSAPFTAEDDVSDSEEPSEIDVDEESGNVDVATATTSPQETDSRDVSLTVSDERGAVDDVEEWAPGCSDDEVVQLRGPCERVSSTFGVAVTPATLVLPPADFDVSRVATRWTSGSGEYRPFG